eukprot:4868946-Pleurochrysis_carterae.AAC.2
MASCELETHRLARPSGDQCKQRWRRRRRRWGHWRGRRHFSTSRPETPGMADISSVPSTGPSVSP